MPRPGALEQAYHRYSNTEAIRFAARGTLGRRFDYLTGAALMEAINQSLSAFGNLNTGRNGLHIKYQISLIRTHDPIGTSRRTRRREHAQTQGCRASRLTA